MPSFHGFLPPTNEVLGKVIFSEACVKNSVHGGGAFLLQGGGRSAPEGGTCSGGCGDPRVTATAAGGMHPTGMHSCF